jgi:hypothetical protein
MIVWLLLVPLLVCVLVCLLPLIFVCVFACVSRCSATQRAGIKLSEEERHRVAMDLKDRLAKVTVLKAKYDTLCARMKAEEGEEERSQAYFVIKAAQRREELQREGDELVRDVPRRAHVHSSCVAVALVGARAVARAAVADDDDDDDDDDDEDEDDDADDGGGGGGDDDDDDDDDDDGSQDAAIRKAEREVKALVATLKQLAESNTAYRVGHQSVCACVVVVRCDASCRLVSAARA